MRKISIFTILLSLTIIFIGFNPINTKDLRSHISIIKSNDTNLTLTPLEVEIIHVSADSNPEKITLSGSLGDIIDFDFDIDGYLYHIYDGKVSDLTERQFVVSKSTYIIIVTNQTELESSVYIDTNGKLLDAKFGFDLSYTSDIPSKPGYLFDSFKTVYSVEGHNVLKATYSPLNTASISIDVEGGTIYPLEPKYNDIVTIDQKSVV